MSIRYKNLHLFLAAKLLMREIVNKYVTMSSEFHLLNFKTFRKAQAVISLPFRLRQGLHEN
ncbi:uncharacterized protein N7511_009110 [Penicillium nucicola]|uniref:uncharacterized protein n=1 Tax=Penicillium nucicola TaxID=1850975 RepID=UPI0025456090|nr:uncharacterized protein N7511_009110 [Penicillium nucicola]KAJ5747414.1 hypothetical protein N7511_009110 [Penicillium nucicola]